jgi:hypothetical protein
VGVNCALDLQDGVEITGNTNKDNRGGGVRVGGAGALLTISGSDVLIAYNQAGYYSQIGGGVAVDGGKCVMTGSGAAIKNNLTTAGMGGGVGISENGGEFDMYAGVISGNIVGDELCDGGGGVGVWSGTFNFYGGTVYGAEGTQAWNGTQIVTVSATDANAATEADSFNDGDLCRDSFADYVNIMTDSVYLGPSPHARGQVSQDTSLTGGYAGGLTLYGPDATPAP